VACKIQTLRAGWSVLLRAQPNPAAVTDLSP